MWPALGRVRDWRGFPEFDAVLRLRVEGADSAIVAIGLGIVRSVRFK
jgi:hypothetical protein